MSTAEADNDGSSSSSTKCRRTNSSEAPESVTYELEDHLALCKKTPTPPLTRTTEQPNDSDFAPMRFDGEPGSRDTLLMEIPEIEGGEDERATVISGGRGGEGGEAVFDSLLVRGAPLSPVAEMDEMQRSMRATGHSFLTISTKSRSLATTSHLNRTSLEETDESSPVQGVVERDTGERKDLRNSEKSIRKSKHDLPNRGMSDMMELDEGKESTPREENGQQTPRKSQIEMNRPSSVRRKSASVKKSSSSRRSSMRGRSRTPRQKRLSAPSQSLLQELLEKLNAEIGSWKHDLGLYIRVRFRDMDLLIAQQLTSHVEKLIKDPTDAECWLEFLRLDLHKTVQMDPSESMKWIRGSGECPPSLRTLYLWALKLSQGQDSEPSYQTLMRDEQQLGLGTPSGEGFLMDAVCRLGRLIEQPAMRLEGSATPRSTDLSLKEAVMDLVDVETRLIEALQNGW